MKRNLTENIKKCSRCAICAAVCPIYKISKNECTLSRGKLLQLLGVSLGHLNFSKKIKKNLDFCLNCGLCTKFCPSEIDVVTLFAQVKAENLTFLDKFLTSEFVFNLKMLPFKIFQTRAPKEKNGTIHFWGCISSHKNDFKCCAMPYLTKGRLDIYEKLMKHNMKIIENPNIKKVIFDCATCFEAVSKYPLPAACREKLYFETDIKKMNVPYTFHKPCHMPQEIFEKLETELKKDPFYRPLKEQTCCGFGGDFFVRHPVMALNLSISLAQKIKETGAKEVISACPTCRWSIKAGKILQKFKR